MTFRPEEVDRFLELFDENKEAIASQPGCSHLQLLHGTSEKNILFTVSIWDHQSSLDAYRNSELFGQVWPQTKALFLEKAEAWSSTKVWDSLEG